MTYGFRSTTHPPTEDTILSAPHRAQRWRFILMVTGTLLLTIVVPNFGQEDAGGTAADGRQRLELLYKSNRIWRILRAPNTMGLFHGLPQRLEKLATSKDRTELPWQATDGGGTLHVKLDIDLESPSDQDAEVFLAFFTDPRWWLAPPVQIRSLSGAGNQVITGVPTGEYYLGAMIGSLPRPIALGVHDAWPEPIQIEEGGGALAHVLVSSEFKWHTLVNDTRDYVGDWPKMDPAQLVSVRTVDRQGRPIPYCRVTFLSGGMFKEAGTDDTGRTFRDDVVDGSTLIVQRHEFEPDTLAQRYQVRRMAGPDPVEHPVTTVRWEPFPSGPGRIMGRVHNQRGEPLTAFHIDLRTAGNAPAESIGMRIPFLASDGQYEVRGLPPGNYKITAYAFDYHTHVYQRGGEQPEFTISDSGGPEKAFNIELEARDLWYGLARFNDSTPVTSGGWRGVHGDRQYSMSLGRDGSFCVSATESERAVLDRHYGGLVEVYAYGSDQSKTSARIHLDKLSRDPRKPTVVKLTRPKSTQPNTKPNVPDNAESVAALRKAGAGIELSQDGTVRRISFLDARADDKDFVHFQGTPSLEQLEFIRTNVSDEALRHLKPLKRLKTLKLAASAVTDRGLEHLKQLQSLEVLDLRETAISDAGIAHLRELARLQSLSLARTRVTSAGVRHLIGLQHLLELNLEKTHVDDESLKSIGQLVSLETLTLNETAIGNAGMQHLAQVKALRDLRLGWTRVTDDGLQHIAGLNQLERLELRALDISDEGVAYLDDLKDLKHLNLSLTRIGDASLEVVAGFRGLTSIHLTDTGVTDDGIKKLTGLANLETLYVSPLVTDAGMPHIKTFKKLKVLGLSGCPITDAGLLDVGEMTTLTNLFLSNTKISDAGLVHLLGLRNLYYATVSGTRVTKHGTAMLWQLPRIQQISGP